MLACIEKTFVERRPLEGVLETVDWSGDPLTSSHHLGEAENHHFPYLVGEDHDFAPLDADLQREMLALKMSIKQGDHGAETPSEFEDKGEDVSADQMSAGQLFR